MNAIPRRWRGYLWWLAGLAVFFAVYFPLRRCRSAMNWLCGRVIFPLEQALGRLCSLTSVSVAEVLILSAVYCAVIYLGWQIRCFILLPHRGRRAGRMGLTLLCVGLSIYAGFCLLWGVFYGASAFQEKSGLTARGGTAEELSALTQYFADRLTILAPQVKRDKDGCFAVSRQEIFDDAMRAYDGIVQEFDCLSKPEVSPKAFVSSRGMSYLDFSGFYFPFTGEANLNDESPACYLPANICHELAHQQGIATEQECNFVGIMAAVLSSSDIYRYSGYLMGYVHLSNALYRVDRDAWQSIRGSLPDTVRADLQENHDYWAQFSGPVQTVANAVYDGFLKSNGLQDGIQNYGTVVDLLLAYYYEGLQPCSRPGYNVLKVFVQLMFSHMRDPVAEAFLG